jgi:hypothetical protein
VFSNILDSSKEYHELNSENGALDFEGKLKAAAKDWGTSLERAITEMSYGHYSNLTKKELAVCLAHCYFIWDQKGYPYNHEGIIEYSMNMGREDSV